jgi:hypothetical protein
MHEKIALYLKWFVEKIHKNKYLRFIAQGLGKRVETAIFCQIPTILMVMPTGLSTERVEN